MHASLCSASQHGGKTCSPQWGSLWVARLHPAGCWRLPSALPPSPPQMALIRRAGLAVLRANSTALLFRHGKCLQSDGPSRRRDISSTEAEVFLVTAGDAVESLFAGFTSFHAGMLPGDRLLFDGGLKFKAASRVLLRQTEFCQQHTRQRIVNKNTLWDAAVCMLSSWWLQF